MDSNVKRNLHHAHRPLQRPVPAVDSMKRPARAGSALMNRRAAPPVTATAPHAAGVRRSSRPVRRGMLALISTSGHSRRLLRHGAKAIKTGRGHWRRAVRAFQALPLWQRLGAALLLLVILSGLAASILSSIQAAHRYVLSSSVSSLIGHSSPGLLSKLTYDEPRQLYQFNKDAVQASGAATNPLAKLKAQVGGAGKGDQQLYSADLPTDLSKGVTYYDNQQQLSFRLTPLYKTMTGQKEQGRLIYPLSDQNAQAIYSVKSNGIKEDLVLYGSSSDTAKFQYRLDLPKTLEARLMPDGTEIGVYSADPALFGNITISSEADRLAVEKAREQSPKNYLEFVIPTPTVKGDGGSVGAAYNLSANTLTISVNGLAKAHYPLTIDPSVVITSSGDFATGNSDDNGIAYGSGQISRGGLTGGTLNASSGAWGSTTSLLATNYYATSVAYNGYIYEIGGAGSAAVDYAPINTADGTLGSWTATTSLPVATYAATSVVYNGFLYEIGGYNVTTVYYAPINTTNGTLGSWTATTSLPVATSYSASVVYNGYVYEIGGQAASATATVDYAPINADGTLGSWTATTSLPVATEQATAVIYNGYVYKIGGFTTATVATVYYAPINADGTLGSWTATTGLPAATFVATSFVYDGYIYEMGGNVPTNTTVATVYYASINANGSLGAWNTTTSLPAVIQGASAAVYNGYVYELGGQNSSNLSSVYYAKIDPAGVLGGWTTNTNSIINARYGDDVVAYNGYLYMLGGYNGTSYYNDVQYAAINSNGSVGAWNYTHNSTNDGTTFVAGFTNARSAAQALVYNGYLYLIGGYNGTTLYGDVQYAPINSNGTIGTWATATYALNTARSGFGATVYNGYIYVAGGCSLTPGSCGNFLNSTEYAPIGASGNLSAAFTTSAAFTNKRTGPGLAVYNGYLYLLGGYVYISSGVYYNDVQFASINTTNGSIGTWNYTHNSTNDTTTFVAGFTNGRIGPGVSVYNGYIYIIGGGSSTEYNDVQYAPLNANGTVGTWATSSSFTTGRDTFGTAVYNGNVYIAGGYGTGPLSDVQYAPINNGGPGTAGTWVNDTASPLPQTLAYATAAVYNGYVYVLGGYSGSATVATVRYAPLNTDGTVGTWTATTSLPQVLKYATSVIYNGYIYELGGYNTTWQSTVYYAPLNTNGTVGTWTSTTALPQTLAYATSVTFNGYVYEIGGEVAANSAVSTVYYAPLNTNGTVGTWTSTTALPKTLYSATSVVNNGYVYELGGYDSSNYQPTVYYAPLNTNGTVGTWTATTSLPQLLASSTTVVSDGYIYELGGDGNGTLQSAVYYAPLNANGTIGAWSSTTALPLVLEYSVSVVANGFVYELGGLSASSVYKATVYYSPLNVIPRVGHFSKLINFGTGATLSSISYNGSLPGGLASIMYRSAGSNGVFGSLQSAGSISGGTGCSPGTTQYAELFFTLDDSQSAGFPDVNATPATITDATVSYSTAGHPTPNLRMHGGKYFSNEAQQPLDTCGP